MTWRNRKYLDLAKDSDCQICSAQDGTIVSCHANQQVFGKGTGVKSSDAASWHGCHSCHAEIDNGTKYDRATRVKIENHAISMTIVRNILFFLKSDPEKMVRNLVKAVEDGLFDGFV